jgi:hypothetical protein
MREKVGRFAPDVVVVSDHARSSLELLVSIASGADPWPAGLAEMLAHVGVGPGMAAEQVRELVLPAQDTIEAWALSAIAEECRQLQAEPVFLLGPYLDPLRGRRDPVAEERVAWQRDKARELGYAILDIRGAFEDETYESAAIVRLENCPSARGHMLMGRFFFHALSAHLAAQEEP